MLEIKEVQKVYDNFQVALHEVSIVIQPGEIIGLLGENGAGKTTLMKSIFGFVTLQGGEICLDGNKIGPDNIHRLAFATSEHSFFGGLSAMEHKSFYQKAFPNFNEKRFQLLMDFFELNPYRKLRKFSTGQKNQFEVILALSQGADYIFMDEPFAGNDIFNREDFYKVLLGILEEHETIILSTHLIEEVKHIVSRVLLLQKGLLIGDITSAKLEEEGIDLMDYLKEQYGYKKDRVMEALMKDHEK